MKVKEHEELVASYERRLAILLRDRDNMMQGIRTLERRMEIMREESTLDSTNLRRLIQLCHPDRHKSSKLSIEMTQMLVKMKDKA
jgi:hypothetical protein